MSLFGCGWAPTLRAYIVFSINRRNLNVPGTHSADVDCNADLVTVKRVVADEDDGLEALEAFHNVLDDILGYAVKEAGNRFVCSLKIDGYVDYWGEYDQDIEFDLTPLARAVGPVQSLPIHAPDEVQ